MENEDPASEENIYWVANRTGLLPSVVRVCLKAYAEKSAEESTDRTQHEASNGTVRN